MPGCGFTGTSTLASPSRPLASSSCPRRRRTSAHLPRCKFLHGRGVFNAPPVYTPRTPAIQAPVRIRCDGTEAVAVSCNGDEKAVPSSEAWMTALHPGAVLEVWSKGELRFARLASSYAKGVIANFVEVSPGASALGLDVKISFDEIVNVWDEDLEPVGADAAEQLAKDVDRGLHFLKNSQPRSLDLLSAYEELRRLPKRDPNSTRSSAQIAKHVFPMNTHGSRQRNAAVTVACAILVATNTIRFKRAGAGQGWRALPSSVVEARGRCSFVDACKGVLEHRSTGSIKRITSWSREQLEILRQLEIFAASGTVARGTAATALEALGYERTDDGAAQLLLDIEYWATGTVESHGGGSMQDTKVEHSRSKKRTGVGPSSQSLDSDVLEGQGGGSGMKAKRTAEWYKNQNMRDWTFPPETLAEARELRTAAREKRVSLLSADAAMLGPKRRNLLNTKDGSPWRVYCIDDKASRFLDDALSAHVLNGSNILRVATHIADVDQVVKSGSVIDDLARERGESLYLPLKPLHMLPAAAMDAASFSPSLPTEAISVVIDLDLSNGAILNWEVFASVVPPVMRLNYDQFDLALSHGAKAAGVTSADLEDLQRLAAVAPILAKKLDQRKFRQRQQIRDIGAYSEGNHDRLETEAQGVASVRLVKKNDRKSASGIAKVVKVVDFRSTGSHTVVGNMLMAAGSLIRQFARENRASLPEDRGASLHAARCGTAPLRKYMDLAILRQVKCVLLGRQPAGRKRMEELRIWLARRHSAGERTVAERRRSALFDSLSSHCSQQCAAAGTQHASVRGKIRGLTTTRKGVLRADVDLDGTGLSAYATISEKLRSRIDSIENSSTKTKQSRDSGDIDLSRPAKVFLTKAYSVIPPGSPVMVQIVNVDTAAQQVTAAVVDVVQ